MTFSLIKKRLAIWKAAPEFAEGEFRQVARDLDAGETFDDHLKPGHLGFPVAFILEEALDSALQVFPYLVCSSAVGF